VTIEVPKTAEEVGRTFNYWDHDLDEDPYPVLKVLRTGCPVARSEELGGYWEVTSYEGVRRVFTEPATFSSRVLTLPPENAPRLVPETIDPPDHARYRRLFTPYFTPRRATELREQTRQVAARLIEDFVAKGGGDIIADFAVPLPCTVFMELAGFPLSDLQQLIVWKDFFMHEMNSDDPVKRQYVAEEVMPAMMGYFGDTVDARLAMSSPPDDLITGLITEEVSPGVKMTREEVLNALLLMVAAGLDTVTAVMGLSLELMAERPDLRKQIVDDPSLIPSATEEFLRYFSIVNTCREASADAEVEGVKISAGDFINVSTASAGRDEKQFPNADEVDIRRAPNPHLAFGAGPHRCLGSHLARMELAVAFEEIVRVMPDFVITPGTSPKHHYGGVIGIDSLELTIRGTGA
jgi:cytochrome P450